MDAKWIVLCAALAGCAPTPIILPDGHQGFSVDCSGLCCNIGDCMNKAAAACAGPYKIVSVNGESTGGVIVPMGTGAMVVNGISRNMIVSCDAH